MRNLFLALWVGTLLGGCKTAEIETIDLDDPEIRKRIVAEAICPGEFSEIWKVDEKPRARYQQTPYTGWTKRIDPGDPTMSKLLQAVGRLSPSGQLPEQFFVLTQYKDGRKHGLEAVPYRNGKWKQQRTWKDGQLRTVVVWKPNGEKCPVSNFVDGNGILVEYNEDGTERSRCTFKDGEPVEQ